MKKILTAIVALMMLAVLACGAVAEDVTGEWYAEAYGMVAKMTINADGTYLLDMGGASDGTWVLEGETLIVDKGTEYESVFAYDAAAQVLNMADELIFGREELVAWAPAAVREVAALTDFEGVWTAQRVDAFGAVLPVNDAGVFMDAGIVGENASLTVTFIDTENFEGEAVLEGNTLTLTVPAKDEYSEAQVFTANALEDGSIAITMDLFSEPATFYMEKVEKLD